MGEKTETKKEIIENVVTREYGSEIDVKSLIYVIRGQQVILDSDLAEIYGYEVKTMNQQVKRNINRFPEDFMFRLTKEEVDFVKSHFVTSRKSSFFEGQEGGRRKPPYAFTEQGIYMLATVLRGEIAEKQSVFIMRAFREMRHLLVNNSIVMDCMNDIKLRQLEYQKSSEEKFEQIFKYIAEHEESSQRLFFEGQIFDAFSLLTNLVQQAKHSIILIDNYVDVKTLNILSKKQDEVTVVIYTMKRRNLAETDIDVFNKQYPTLEVRYVDGFHDRFLIIDGTRAYHIGASIKDAGRKCFGITKIEEQKYIEDILRHLQ